MKVYVFIYAALIFGMTLFVSVGDYVQNLNLNRTLQHAYHRSLMETMGKDLNTKERIKKDFSTLFLARTPQNMTVLVDVVDFNPAPKILRIKIRADYQGNLFVFDETLIEEVVRE